MKVRSILIIGLSLLFSLSCEQPSAEKRKIKLAADHSPSLPASGNKATILKLDATEKKNIVILTFNNQTNNKKLDWLSQGIADMLIRDLSQSPRLHVVSLQRLYDIFKLLDNPSLKTPDQRLLQKIGVEAQAEAIITGNFAIQKDTLLVSVQLYDVKSRTKVAARMIGGYGLENLFGIVDNLSKQIRADLHLSLEEKNFNIADITTNSLEAYQQYSRGIDLLYKAYFGDAVRSLEQAIDADSTFAMAHLWLSIGYQMVGRDHEAKAAIARAVQFAGHASPKEQMKIRWISYLYNDNHDAAFDMLLQLVQEYPDDKELHYQLAGNYYYRQELGKAQAELNKAFALDPNYLQAYQLQSYVYQQSAKYDSAIMSLEKAIAIAPKEAGPYFNLGEICSGRGDYQKAEKYYQKALAVKPDFYHASLALAQLYLDTGKYQAAREKYLATLPILPSEELKATVYSGLANIDRSQGKYQAAIDHLKQALQFPSSDQGKTSYWGMIAGIYLRKGQPDSALAITRQILAIDPNNFYIYNVICDAWLKKGQIDSARQRLRQLDEFIQKSKYEILRNLSYQLQAKISAAEGNPAVAIEFYQKILATNPEATGVWESIGKVYLDSQQPQQAIENFQKFLALNPNAGLAKYQLGLAYAAAGDSRRAKRMMRDFLEDWQGADPDIPEMITARQYVN
ncbi:MAG: tetratricopeptide repeat protein [candidate division KSB1 bacterium]|nr:tetratricopeptide repeat protein [candidate division KSB1 bacterium]MDZ7341133.1 tetratricopeptide repeat protein [candidate division KSB1 bacterium]